ncbi:MAG: potassium-transporting ATPase subunit KdpA [Thermoplasmatales archaeon]|nr:potassium-transporting ATPase subunit KdpA [Thermoplasmatales archaeon]MCW6169845.1 potassium-transporting ATPase subunit KdpA [Thermoplasmatales archaeon]
MTNLDVSSNGSFWSMFFLQNRLVSGAIIIIIYILIMLIFAYLISGYISSIYLDRKNSADRILRPILLFAEKLFGEDSSKKMKLKEYFLTLILFNASAGIIAFLFLYFQNKIPFFGSYYQYSPSLVFNTVTSFLTNTDLQNYSNPLHLSYFSTTFVLTGLMFLSAGTGFAASKAFIHGIKNDDGYLGNFYHDFLVAIIYLIFPLTLIVTIILLPLGVPQTMQSYVIVHPILSNSIFRVPLGPVATWEAIKNIGTNGGGFYGANAASPFENPNWISNLVEFVSFTIIPLGSLMSLRYIFNDKRFVNMLIGVLLGIFLFTTFMTFFGEYVGIPQLSMMGIIYNGNMIGKETAIGLSQSSIFSTGAVFTSTGAAATQLLTFTPAGILGVLGNLILNDPLGGVGTGVLNIFMYVIFAIFITALMVGKLPELMSLKIGSKEIKYSTLSLVTHPLLILIPFGVTIFFLPHILAPFTNPRSDIITEIFYEFASAASNNGSAMGGFTVNQPYLNYVEGVIMLLGRYLLMFFQLAVAQSFAYKIPKVQLGRSIDTGSFTFGLMLFSTMILLGVLSFFPILAVGPFEAWGRAFGLFIGVV